MSGGPGLKVRKFIRTKAFDNGFKVLPDFVQHVCHTVFKEMQSGKYSQSRDLKKIKGTKKNKQTVWQVRLTRDYRMRFHFKKGKGEVTLLLVGQHKIFK